MTDYDRETLVQVLVHHQRSDIQGCDCGWSVLGASHPEHVADMYELMYRTCCALPPNGGSACIRPVGHEHRGEGLFHRDKTGAEWHV